MKVFNRGRRQFQHKLDGVNYVSDPGKFTDVPKELAEQWLTSYPRDFITQGAAAGDNVRAENDIKVLREENAALKTELALVKGLLESHGIEKPTPSILTAVDTPSAPKAKPGPKAKVKAPV